MTFILAIPKKGAGLLFLQMAFLFSLRKNVNQSVRDDGSRTLSSRTERKEGPLKVERPSRTSSSPTNDHYSLVGNNPFLVR